MKAIKIYNILLGCVLALGLSSCVETAPEYVPGEKAASSSVVSADITAPVTIELDGSPIAAPFTRSDASSAVTVNVSLSDDSGLFSLQSNTVSFASGEKVAYAYVNYDYDKLDSQSTYKVDVTMTSEEYASPYKIISVPYTCTKAWKDLGMGQFFDQLVLMSSDSYGIANCKVLQSPDGALRYRIMAPYADKAQRAAAWDEDCAQATPCDYIEFWVKDEDAMTVTWDKFWLTGLWYGGTPGDDIKAYLPSVRGASDANCCFVEEKVVQFTPYYYIDGLGGFGMYACYLSFPGGPDLETWL